MPIYAYKCASCGHAKDVLRKMSDEPLTVCPACGESRFEKQLTAAGFQLKGSGWYVTDFRGGQSAAPAAEGDSPGASGEKPAGGKADVAEPAKNASKDAASPASSGAAPAAPAPAPSAAAGPPAGAPAAARPPSSPSSK